MFSLTNLIVIISGGTFGLESCKTPHKPGRMCMQNNLPSVKNILRGGGEVKLLGHRKEDTYFSTTMILEAIVVAFLHCRNTPYREIPSICFM